MTVEVNDADWAICTEFPCQRLYLVKFVGSE